MTFWNYYFLGTIAIGLWGFCGLYGNLTTICLSRANFAPSNSVQYYWNFNASICVLKYLLQYYMILQYLY